MASSVEKEIKELIKHKVICVKCSKTLIKSKNSLICIGCKMTFRRSDSEVWDFRVHAVNRQLPKIFFEEEYLRWVDIFEKKEVFNWSIYKTRFRKFFSQAGHRKIAKMVKKDINERDSDKSNHVLEIGSGGGALLEHLDNINYIGIDTSMKVLSILKKKHPNAITLCLSDVNLPFGDGTFERIVSLHTLEHIYFIAEHIEHVIRVLKNQGKYFYVIPTEGGLSFYLGRQFFTGPHVRKKYNIDANYIMDREHINDAKRVLKFLKIYFKNITKNYWPLRLSILSLNAMIFGVCIKKKDSKKL